MKWVNVKKLLKNLFALSLLALLVYLVGPAQLIDAFKNVSAETICYLMLVSVLLVYVSAVKWQLFVEELGSRISAWPLFQLYLVGYFVNLIIPSYVGGDAVRSYYVGKDIGQHEAFTATILERFTGFVAMMLLALCFVWSNSLVNVQLRVVIVLLALGLAVATVIALSKRSIELFSKLPRMSKVVKHLYRVQDGFHLARKNRLLFIKALLLSLVYHSFTVVNTLFAAQAVGWTGVPVWELFVVLPPILIIGSLPISPSGLGIQEGAFFYFLQQLGATPEQAFGVGLVLRAKSYILALVGGLFWLKVKNQAGQLPNTATAPLPEALSK